MAKLQTKWIEDDAVNESKFKLSNDGYLRGRKNDDSADVNIVKVNASDEIEFASVPVSGGNALESTANKGAANGYAPLNASSKIDTAYLPSYVDDVEEYADLASFPGTGETGKIYVALDTNKTYRWSGSAYVEISPSEVNSVNGETGVVVLDTDDVNEGASNLYFTEAKVEDTTLANYTVGANTALANTDDVKGAFGKVQGQINALASATQSFAKDEFVIDSTDLTNEYVTLSNTPIANSVRVFVSGSLEQREGVDYSLTGAQLDFDGDLLSLLAENDVLIVSYAY